MEDRRMLRSGVGADASSFFLFEATGDSEVDGGHEEEVPMEEDDAASCSCDSSGWTGAGGGGVGVGGCDVAAWLGDGREEDEEDEELDDEQNSRAHQLPGAEYKSRVSVESTGELMNEMERSKLFWEACLAS
ncbi:uncharacterized protein LOC115742431 [Rhodamnia argentea]|uniref:Uncharacterized protein LOC115742431 n=1 Tax=Rhodamnia argentea TaxID=178133 RepID=A0A8B8PET0_9MYRT|nr:uncharacterized protein LOC115742431 [Rhodamnia argentea]